MENLINFLQNVKTLFIQMDGCGMSLSFKDDEISSLDVNDKQIRIMLGETETYIVLDKDKIAGVTKFNDQYRVVMRYGLSIWFKDEDCE